MLRFDLPSPLKLSLWMAGALVVILVAVILFGEASPQPPVVEIAESQSRKQPVFPPRGWELSPPRASAFVILNDAYLKKCEAAADAGDMEAVIALARWFDAHEEREKAAHWKGVWKAEMETRGREPALMASSADQSGASFPIDWPLLPPPYSWHWIFDDTDVRMAEKAAKLGDRDAIAGLVEWYQAHGESEKAMAWSEILRF